jgi:hypothetical protein
MFFIGRGEGKKIVLLPSRNKNVKHTFVLIMPSHSLSKTSFLKFEQCPKAFYFYKNLPYLKDKPSIDKQLTFKRGHDVGFFARQLFPGGTDVAELSTKSELAVQLTAELVANKTPVIYEATFMFNGVLIMVDILCLENDRYIAYEVKSSLRVSDFFLRDACLQYYVLKQALPGFEDLFLVTVNGDYVKHGEIEPRKLFRKRSVKQKAEEHFSYFDLQVKAALLVLEQNKIPNIPVGPQCFRPYQCDFFTICWKEDLHENSVFNLPLTNKETQFDWHRSGMKLIDQVPDEILEKESLVKIKKAFVLNEPFFDPIAIGRFILRVKEPVCAMDMEIWNPALPELEGTKPFEQIPFLAGFYHKEGSAYVFCDHKEDERRQFAEGLIKLSLPYSTVLVYDKNLEVNVIINLEQRFPELKNELETLRSKLLDVFDVFLKMYYYHPAFRNSFSLKVTSSVLLGEVNYGTIVSGLEAMSYFAAYRSATDEIQKKELYEKLVHYCITDSKATFLLYEFLRDLLKQKAPSV